MKRRNEVDVKKLTGSDTLIGKTGGMRDFPKFLEAVLGTPAENTVIFDWSTVEIATASYFGTTVLPLLRMSMAGDVNRYFVHVGLNQNCLDELKLVIEFQNLAVLVGDSTVGDSIQNIRVVGKLEKPYSETLAMVEKLESVSATALHESQANKSVKIGKGGWANRLSYLFRLRLVRKERIGRELVFQAIHGGE
jgi:hypothetical protein